MEAGYEQFIASKRIRSSSFGFNVRESEINPLAFDWQAQVIRWSLRIGRCAIFADCGLGKTFIQLEFARHVVRRENKPVLLLCPIAVAAQTIREARKFDIACDIKHVASQSDVITGINITNYEKLHLFDPHSFVCVVLDESSILKSYTGATKQALCKLFSNTPYRLCCTATPAPNDRIELGNHSQFLGVMESAEMLTRWFLNDSMKAGGYRLRKHAAKDFWRWMSSWAVCLASPEDLGYPKDGFILPPLILKEHIVRSAKPPEGMLFHVGESINATEVHKEKRRCLVERVDVVQSLANNSTESWVIWCDTDYEADALREAIPDAIEVRGSQPERIKEERLTAFSEGRERVIITKPEIGGFGLNWQHCHNTTWFAGYSFERFYQAIRRLYRYGQTLPVNVHTVMSDAEQSIVKTVKRKQNEHQEMFSEMAKQMRDGMLENIRGIVTLRSYEPNAKISIPNWLTERRSA